MKIHKHRTESSGSRPGFTLIEVLIATAVIGVGFMAAATMQSMSIKHNHKSWLVTSATYLAMDKIEELRNLPNDQITAAGSPESDIDETGTAGGVFTRSWTVQVDQPAIGMREVDVTVAWQERGQNRNIQVSTVIYNP
jgi:type IV pilus assembly protein PilV